MSTTIDRIEIQMQAGGAAYAIWLRTDVPLGDRVLTDIEGPLPLEVAETRGLGLQSLMDAAAAAALVGEARARAALVAAEAEIARLRAAMPDSVEEAV